MFENLSKDEMNKIFSNPFYCLAQIDEIFVAEHEPLISESDWIAANIKLIKEMGSEQWLTLLLDNLKGNYVKSTEEGN